MSVRTAAIFAAMLSAALLCAGNEVPGNKTVESFPKTAESPARELAGKLVLGLVDSLKSGDYAAFKAAQPAGDRAVKKETFEQMRQALSKRYGTLVGAEYFGVLDQGRVADFLWKLTFERSGASGATRREIVCWVRVGIENGEPMIAGFSFNFF